MYLPREQRLLAKLSTSLQANAKLSLKDLHNAIAKQQTKHLDQTNLCLRNKKAKNFKMKIIFSGEKVA